MSPASYQTAPPRDAALTAGLLPLHWRKPQRLQPLRSSGQGFSPAAEKAGNGTRTRDPNLGKVVLYQLSYSREADEESSERPPSAQLDPTALEHPCRDSATRRQGRIATGPEPGRVEARGIEPLTS
jgi:hypothetical protein